MDNNLSDPQDQKLDDLLSKFTNQVLSDEKDKANMQETTNSDELAELQKTVLRMKAAVQTARLSHASEARIRAHLLTEWKKTRRVEQQTPKRLVWNWTLPRIALVGGFAILIIFSAITLSTPTPSPLMGTANGPQSGSPLLILAGIVVIVLLLWHNRHD
jgi:hypothetical protein